LLDVLCLIAVKSAKDSRSPEFSSPDLNCTRPTGDFPSPCFGCKTRHFPLPFLTSNTVSVLYTCSPVRKEHIVLNITSFTPNSIISSFKTAGFSFFEEIECNKDETHIFITHYCARLTNQKCCVCRYRQQ